MTKTTTAFSGDSHGIVATRPDAKRVHLFGLDSIRFVMALWVTMGHYDLPPLPHFFQNESLLRAFALFYKSAVNGPAAVIVFFLVSGLCIHFPNRNRESIDNLWSYYTRRLIRIGLPLLIAAPISRFLGVKFEVLRTGIYWSIVAEAIYYVLYPGLLKLSVQFGWRKLIIAAYVAAYALMFAIPHETSYGAFGDHLNWILGLPCWLLGCLIAQEFGELKAVSTKRIWLMRAMLFGTSCLATFMRWHMPRHLNVGFNESLDVFALIAYFWLRDEVSYYRNRKPSSLLEKAGAFSYSLYLWHGPARFIWDNWIGPRLPHVPAIAIWFPEVGFALLVAYMFYVAVERPSHVLAIRFGRELKDKKRIVRPVLADRIFGESPATK